MMVSVRHLYSFWPRSVNNSGMLAAVDFSKTVAGLDLACI